MNSKGIVNDHAPLITIPKILAFLIVIFLLGCFIINAMSTMTCLETKEVPMRYISQYKSVETTMDKMDMMGEICVRYKKSDFFSPMDNMRFIVEYYGEDEEEAGR